ncbi:MAG: iron-containing alcohol dehydrogenase [Clostridiales bacterium]|uniref:iron-containing alcohol dehydrogenase n=1 Tax=Flavonifractor porci TaxID=3133422 RepID=UPI0030A6944B|nr:iron-containing alcohol dehydrogenase [Clostridiales bacterium]
MRSGTLIQLCAGRYYQGSGVLSHLGEDAALLGTRVLILADPQVWPKVEQAVTDRLAQHGIVWQVHLFSGICCPTNFRAAAEVGRAFCADAVIGVGGGRALDAAKITADLMEARTITVPTSAATCAASAWLAVEYTEQGAFAGNYWPRHPPFAVVADLDILVRECPPRYNIIGFVDAMAKYPEISYNILHFDQWEQNAFSRSARLLAHSTYDLLLSSGGAVYEALKQGRVDPVTEDCICAALQLTGLISAMACGGKQAAISHCLYSYFCACRPEIRSRFLHGELVGASLVYQLAVNGAPRTEQEALDRFLRRFELPACLEELGLADSPGERDSIFAFLAKHMPVTEPQELERLQAQASLLFHGLK